MSWSLRPSRGTSTSSSGSEAKTRRASGAKRLARQQPGETAGISCAISSAWVALWIREACSEWLRVTQTTCPTQIGTESLKFSSGFSVNKDAFLLNHEAITMYMKRHIIIFIEWSGLPVSALTLPSVVFSPLITDLVFLSQLNTMIWNAWSGSERRVSLGGTSFTG